MVKFVATLFGLFAAATAVTAAAVASPPSNVPSVAGPPTREMHEIRTNALEEIKNATIAARDSYGDGTYYDVSVGYTACGGLYDNNAWVVAVSHDLFDTYPGATPNPNNNPICGKKIWLWGWYGTSPTDVTIVDKCAGCAYNDIDMTPAVFRYVVGDTSLGRKPIGWNWY